MDKRLKQLREAWKLFEVLLESSFRQNIASLISKKYTKVDPKLIKQIDNFVISSDYNLEGKLTLVLADKVLDHLNKGGEMEDAELRSKMEQVSDFFSWYKRMGKQKGKIKEKKDDPVISKLLNYIESDFNAQSYKFVMGLYQFIKDNHNELDGKLEDQIQASRDTSHFNPVVEMKLGGRRYAAYKVENRKQATDRCWLSDPSKSDSPVYCVASEEGADWIKQYGGYPFYMIMVGPTQKQEDIFAAYLPNALDEDLDNAVRNRANTYRLEPNKFERIIPLLYKVDSRIENYLMEYLPFTLENIKKYNYDLMGDKDGNLIKAAEVGSVEVVKLLLDAGADVNGADKNITIRSKLPLSSACSYGNISVVKFLLDNGANIYAQDGEALYYASENGHVDVVKLLIAAPYRADVNSRNGQLLSVASEEGHLEVVEALIDSGAGFGKPEAYSNAIEVAYEAGYHKIVDLLEKSLEEMLSFNDYY